MPGRAKARTLRLMRDHLPEGAATPGRDPSSDEGHDVPSAASGAHAEAPEVWHGSATNRIQWLLAAIGGGCLALGIGLAVGHAWTSSPAPLVMSVVGCVAVGLLVLFGTLAFVHVSVRINKDLLDVRCGHIGVPRRTIPLDRVVDAEFAPRVTPCHWGGWGYRWRPEQGTAVVVRRGEGLVLRLSDGRTFTVTVDDAEGAVRCLQHLIRRRKNGPVGA